MAKTPSSRGAASADTPSSQRNHDRFDWPRGEASIAAPATAARRATAKPKASASASKQPSSRVKASPSDDRPPANRIQAPSSPNKASSTNGKTPSWPEVRSANGKTKAAARPRVAKARPSSEPAKAASAPASTRTLSAVPVLREVTSPTPARTTATAVLPGSEAPVPTAVPQTQAPLPLHPQGGSNWSFDHAFAQSLDRAVQALAATRTAGAAPLAGWLAFADLSLSLTGAPGTRMAAARSAFHQWQRYVSSLLSGQPAIVPSRRDSRFTDPNWNRAPFLGIAQAFLLTEEWLDEVIKAVPGIREHNRDLARFLTRQIMDAMSPSNVAAFNPEVVERTIATRGANFIEGLARLREDAEFLFRREEAHKHSGWTVGKDLAITPGTVVFRNELIELIQYAPTTAKVRPEPVLIVPAWIMKYYILDLSPDNSLIRWLVSQGFTVFCISWRNPDASFAQTGLDDYRILGFKAALDAALAITGSPDAHVTGYCLGGTMSTIAAAAMARDGDDRIRTLSFFAAQADFTEAGELSLFIDEKQLLRLDAQMAERGYLNGAQMQDAFVMLGSRDLVWSKAVRSYLLGEPSSMNDLMAWNADTTRMPARMHSQYLRELFLENRLARGQFLVDGRPIAVSDIRTPIFAVGTQTDHVAPWRSAFKIHLLNDGDVTFVLTKGGHNAGIVSEPGHPRRDFRILHRPANSQYIDPDTWLAQSRRVNGSWWPAWGEWLAAHSGAPVPAPRTPGMPELGYTPLEPAPGQYVHQT